jgi:hypothetical protein
LPGAGAPFAAPAANDDARSGLGRRRNRRFVLPLDGRIGNLKDIEDAHRYVIFQIRKGAGHPDEPHLAGVLQFKQSIDRAIVLKRPLRWRTVELHHIEMIGLHATQALLDPGDNVLRREHMRTAVAARRRRRADQAAAFAGEIILIAQMPDVAADALLAEPVIDRRVNVVDPGIEHRVEDRFGLGFTDVAGARRAAQFHRAVAEHRYLETGAPEFALWQFGHRTSFIGQRRNGASRVRNSANSSA